LRQRKDKHPLFGYTEAEDLIMEHTHLSGQLTVAEALARWPQAIPIFFRYRMACVGCSLASFETLAEIAAVYNLNLDRFLSELEQMIQLEQERI
jgi:hybrid cluster-associated redox disulfide protein